MKYLHIYCLQVSFVFKKAVLAVDVNRKEANTKKTIIRLFYRLKQKSIPEIE